MNLRPAFSGGFRIAATLLLNHSPAACVGLRCCSCSVVLLAVLAANVTVILLAATIARRRMHHD